MTDVGQCARNPATSQRINVDAMLELLNLFQEFEIKPVFFSSDLVFDGICDIYDEDDIVCPSTRYGRQKADIELEIQRRFPSHLIFRTSKLMSMDLSRRNILTPVIQNLRAGMTVNAFADQFITPVFVEDIARVAIGAFREGLNGTYHLAGEDRLSRFELAHVVADSLGFSASLVAPTSMKNFALEEPRGSNNALSSAKICSALDLRFTPLAEGLDLLREQKDCP